MHLNHQRVIRVVKETNFYRYICLQFSGFIQWTFMTVSSQLKFLPVLNFEVWDTIAKKEYPQIVVTLIKVFMSC